MKENVAKVSRESSGFILVIIIAIFALQMAWIGYQGWNLDDAHYVQAAEGWASEQPYIGTTHWELRNGFVLPLAASVAIFGSKEPALLAVPIVFFLAIILITYLSARRFFGLSSAIFIGIVVATVPILPGWGTTPRVAIAETFYCIVAFWLYVYAVVGNRHDDIALFISGIFLGFACLCRESSFGLAFVFLFLFLLGWPLKRKKYLMLAVGFGSILLIEMVFYWIYTGNALYRPYIGLNHGIITASGGEINIVTSYGQPSADTAASYAPSGILFVSTKNFFEKLMTHFDWSRISSQEPVSIFNVNAWVNPYIQFLTEPYYGLVFWLIPPAYLYLFVSSRTPPLVRTICNTPQFLDQ
jgi:4-amino-4-deoxy-L-arabinose transferase-like glycosyltransferase